MSRVGSSRDEMLEDRFDTSRRLTIKIRGKFNEKHDLPENEGIRRNGSWTPRTQLIEDYGARFSNPKRAIKLMLIGRKNSEDYNEKLEMGYYHQGLGTQEELTEEHIKNAETVADGLRDFVLGKELVEEGNKVLDLGSGLGFFVDSLNNMDIETIGIEPKDALRNQTEIENNLDGQLISSSKKITGLEDDQKFDRIFMNAPFIGETHNKLVKTLKKYLEDDGKLILSIPTNGLMQTVFSLEGDPEEHLDNNPFATMTPNIQFAQALNKHFNVETIYDAIEEKEKTGVNELIGGGFAFVVVLTPKKT